MSPSPDVPAANGAKNRPLHLLPGLGPVTAGWLREVGIETEADLRALGAAAAYRRLRHRDPKRASLNALWALHSALTGVPWNQIDAETKARLREEAGANPPGRRNPGRHPQA